MNRYPWLLEQRIRALAELAQGQTRRCTLIVLVQYWDLAVYVDLLRRWLPTLDSAAIAAWCANFTKTIVLTGRPTSPAYLRHLDRCAPGLGLCLADDHSGARFIKALPPLQARVDPELGLGHVSLLGQRDAPRSMLEWYAHDSNLANHIVDLTHLLAEASWLGGAPLTGHLTMQPRQISAQREVSRAWGVEASLVSSEDHVGPMLRPMADAMGQEHGESRAAAAQLPSPPALPDRLASDEPDRHHRIVLDPSSGALVCRAVLRIHRPRTPDSAFNC